MEESRVLLSVRDLDVKFHVRGRTLSAIRGISLDIYENESIAIVGESGCGKSVFTKTFAGMLDNNGFIDHGDIFFYDRELSDTVVELDGVAARLLRYAQDKLNEYAKLELGAATYQKILALEQGREEKASLSSQETGDFRAQQEDLSYRRAEAFNRKQQLDSKKEKDAIRRENRIIADCDAQLKELRREKEQAIRAHQNESRRDAAYHEQYAARLAQLRQRYTRECAGTISDQTRERNRILAKEIYLSIGRYPLRRRLKLLHGLTRALRKAMQLGVDLSNEEQRNGVFDAVAFRVKYLDETPQQLHGECAINLSKISYSGDWGQIRGKRIATIFQDPMTSLNPIITIGKQITAVIMKHQNVTEPEARKKAMEMMKKVGIPNAEYRFDDYPFQYSGGMRQRIVIAIALSCRPKILICDEPTTALDVTIQAQILKLIKHLQKELHYTIVFITHDLGVVANVADRVAVLYAGQIVELGKVDEVFYDPRHPYTWALLSSLPQLASQDTELYSIAGSPPSLYNKIKGDAFAPRNPYCIQVDTLQEPPMFQITDTHYAKTWLMDPRAPKLEKPETIRDIHGTLMKVFNIQ